MIKKKVFLTEPIQGGQPWSAQISVRSNEFPIDLSLLDLIVQFRRSEEGPVIVEVEANKGLTVVDSTTVRIVLTGEQTESLRSDIIFFALGTKDTIATLTNVFVAPLKKGFIRNG